MSPTPRSTWPSSRGDVNGASNVLCRVHSECWTSEVLGSLKCDCREQLEAALERIAAEGTGVVVYLRQEGRGIGLGNKVRAYALQNERRRHRRGEPGARASRPTSARYDLAAAILADLGVRSVRLLTNNPLKVAGLRAAGVVVDRADLALGRARTSTTPPTWRSSAARWGITPTSGQAAAFAARKG